MCIYYSQIPFICEQRENIYCFILLLKENIQFLQNHTISVYENSEKQQVDYVVKKSFISYP